MRWNNSSRSSIRQRLGLTFVCITLSVSCREKPASSAKTSPQNIVNTQATATAQVDPRESIIPQLPQDPDADFAPDIDLASEHLTRGNELLAAGMPDEAIAEYLRAVKFNPDDEDTYYNLAFAYARAGRRDLAKTNYLKALEIFPDYAEVHNNLGNLLVADGQFQSAIEHFQRVIELDDQNASAHNNLGNALARSGKVASSLVHFQTAVQLKPTYAEAQFNLANAYLVLGLADEAVAEFSNLLQLQPAFPRAHDQLQKARALQERNAPQAR